MKIFDFSVVLLVSYSYLYIHEENIYNNIYYFSFQIGLKLIGVVLFKELEADCNYINIINQLF